MTKASLFDINLSIIDYQTYVQNSVRAKGYSCFLNSHMIYEYHKLPGFKNVLNEASYILPDGMPARFAVNYFNNLKQDRIAGNDIIFSLVDQAKEKQLKVFLIGTTDEVLQNISAKLKLESIVHETYSPPFLPIDKFDFDYQASLINAFQPDIVLVGLGCPKQEIWMHKMAHKIDAHLYGLGGAFLLYAGVDSKAPQWLRNIGLEWLYRLMLEPNRLFKRYLTTNTYFCTLFARKVWKNRFR